VETPLHLWREILLLTKRTKGVREAPNKGGKTSEAGERREEEEEEKEEESSEEKKKKKKKKRSKIKK